MMTRFRALFRSTLVFIFCFHAIIGQASDNVSQQTFDQVLGIVDRDFYDQSFKGLPWKELQSSYRTRLKGNESPEVVQSVINELLGLLKTSHTAYYLQSDQTYWGLQSIFSHDVDGFPVCQIGAWFEKIENRWFVKNVFPGSPSANAGFLSGDEIVNADQKLLSPIASFANCSKKTEVQFRRRAGGKIRRVFVQPINESFQRSLLRASELSSKLIVSKEAKIGYFHLWSGTHDSFLSALKTAITKHQTSDAFILDLRDGFGGAYFEYIQPFLSHDEEGNSIKQVYSKPLVVLVNQGTRSGKEYISYLLRKENRATFVGTTTAGAVIAGKPFEIATAPRSLLFLAVQSPGEDGLEGVGFVPDHYVSNFLPYRQGRDPQLEFAIHLAEKLSKKSH